MADEGVSRHPLSLRGMVGHLRRRLTSGAHPDAASALARLAAEHVPGADPESWYGLLEPSTVEPLVDLSDPQARASVSPSKLDTIEKSTLAWFIDAMSAGGSGLAAAIGTVVHAAMETVSARADGDVSVEAVWQEIEERWDGLAFESGWIEERERRRVRQVARGVSDYLGDFASAGGVLLRAEGSFELEVGHARVRGKIDRIERTSSGAVVIVDLKTGRSAPSAAELAEHAQLGSYQLAFTDGALPEVAGEGFLGGAKLVFVALGRGGRSYREDEQGPLDAEALGLLRDRLDAAAIAIAEPFFVGRLDLPERDPHAAYEYRIHLVPAVSA